MRKKYILFILLYWSVQAQSQAPANAFTGNWKCYLADSTTFEFLALAPNGTGIKCFGHTIDGEDKLFLDGDATLTITQWKVERFHRVVVYQRANKIDPGFSIKAAPCLMNDSALFSFKPVDSTFQLAGYKGFDDLIPHLLTCDVNYQMIRHYFDAPYSMVIPRAICHRSFGYGNMAFNISLQSREANPVNTIQIYYDFDNSLRDFYFTEMQNGKRERDSVLQNGKEIYRTKNWQGKFEGDIFIGNSLIVSYFTTDEKMQETLQNCIASFQYINRRK